jgi:hypothetical protein
MGYLPLSTIPMDGFGDLGLTFNQQPNLIFNNSGYSFDVELFNMLGVVPDNIAFSAEFHQASGSRFQPSSIADLPVGDLYDAHGLA